VLPLPHLVQLCSSFIAAFFFYSTLQEDRQKNIFLIFFLIGPNIAAHIQGYSQYVRQKSYGFILKKSCVKRNTESVQKFECGLFDTVQGQHCTPAHFFV
jgi:hypothetical protein